MRSRDARTQSGTDGVANGRIQAISRSIRGVTNHRSCPMPLGGRTSNSMRQIAALLEFQRRRAPISRAASSPMFGS